MTLQQAQLAEVARAAAQPREVTTGEIKTSFWFYPARNKTSPKESIVLIHGYRGNHHGLEAIAGAIENYDVYIPDLPGFGASEAFKATHDIDSYAKWLDEFIDSLKLQQKPHLLGHSFGSIVVSAYAARFDGISTLMLENPIASPALKGPKALMTGIAKAFFWLAGALPEKSGDAILKSWPMVRGMSIVMAKSRIGELRRWIHHQHDRNFNDFASRRVALEGYETSISNCVGDYADRIKVPVLMLIGEKDDITSVSQQQKLLANLASPKKELIRFSKVGHLTHYEIPQAIAEAIEIWVRDND
jgi:pimeloyl-ACP methyl ester carboxylesterase